MSARMYRTTGAMIEGWTKNLALLFNNTLATAIWKAIDFGLLFLPAHAWRMSSGMRASRCTRWQWLGAGWVLALLWVRTLIRFYARVAKSNFPVHRLRPCLRLGLPLFVVLLYRSWFQHRILKRVSWKGREYKS